MPSTLLVISISIMALGSAVVTAGCSSKSAAAAGSDGTSDADCASAPVSFQTDVMPIFAANCSTSSICHGQMGNAGVEDLYLGLSATEGTNGPSVVAGVQAGLVGVKSAEDPSMNLVTPGDLEDSYLWHKVSGDQNDDPTVVSGCQPAATGANPCSDCVSGAPCGVQMPFANTLDPSAVCAIQNWITQGAKND
jgi:hypothetical protein